MNKNKLFEILMGEIGCSKEMKNIIINMIKNGENFIGNLYEIKSDEENIKINNLYDNEESYTINKTEFINLLEDFLKENC